MHRRRATRAACTRSLRVITAAARGIVKRLIIDSDDGVTPVNRESGPPSVRGSRPVVRPEVALEVSLDTKDHELERSQLYDVFVADSASPSTLKQSTVRKMNAPGKIPSQGSVVIVVCA